MNVAEESIIKSTGRINAYLECWRCTNSPRYNAYRFHTYINYPNKMDPDFTEGEKKPIKEYAQNNS